MERHLQRVHFTKGEKGEIERRMVTGDEPSASKKLVFVLFCFILGMYSLVLDFFCSMYKPRFK